MISAANTVLSQDWFSRALLFIALVAVSLSAPAQDQTGKSTLQWRSATMGTKYSVKIFDPPDFPTDVRLAVDAELRRVNDQMSTYLKSSELGRFNASSSTDWFEVSRDTARVVQFAQEVAEKTDGAFDVTVGPLVNAWGFGPAPRSGKVPSEDRLKQLQESVGFQKLSVRLDPPALRKSVPQLQVDLSALAKGHGVDRVVELLDSMGAPNVFVEIGGEVRTSGSKDDQWWRVGIQKPESSDGVIMIAHPMSTQEGQDESMATSGDYQNQFEADGKRYSHTIDLRTGRPVEHDLTSVSVITQTCMAADAWATAINVLGAERGLELAKREGLDVLLARRGKNGLILHGTGVLAQYAQPAEADGADQGTADRQGGTNALAIVMLTLLAFGAVLSAMAVGVIFGKRSISGSCGGLSSSNGEEGGTSCSLCSNPSDACKELRAKMHENANEDSLAAEGQPKAGV